MTRKPQTATKPSGSSDSTPKKSDSDGRSKSSPNGSDKQPKIDY